MKKLKLSIMSLLTVCLLALGSGSAFAAKGWADSISTAQPVYLNPSLNIGQIIEEYDQDYYSYENTSPYRQEVNVALYLPSDVTVDILRLVYRADGTVDVTSSNGVTNYLFTSMVVNAGDKVVYGIINRAPNGYYVEGYYEMRWEKRDY